MKIKKITMRVAGKDYRVVIPGVTEEKAEEKPRNDIFQEVCGTAASIKENMTIKPFTVKDCINIYINTILVKGDPTPSAKKTYTNYRDNYFAFIRDIPMEALTMDDIQASIEEETSHMRGPKTIRNAYSFLKKVLKVYRPDMVFKKGTLTYPGEIEGVLYSND